MLDQNTDRMWYVIGAVIVGATIILILNGTMPQLFASVADTFKVKTETVTEITDGIGPKVRPRKNYLLDSDAPKTINSATFIDYYLDVNEFNELSGNTVTVSFDAKAEVDGAHYLDAYFRVHDGTIRNFEISEVFNLTSEYQRFTFTTDIPDFTKYLDYDMSFRFRGNQYVVPEEGNKNGFSTRRVKMELGTNDTGYIPHEKEVSVDE